MYITLEQAKKHLLVDESFKDDDLYILDLITVAQDSVEKHLDTPLSELESNGQLPSAVIHAMLLLVGNFYASRESFTSGSIAKIPYSYEYLLSLYKKY